MAEAIRRSRWLRRHGWPAATCAILAACSGSEDGSTSSGDGPHPDAREAGDDAAAGDAARGDDSGGDGVRDARTSDIGPDAPNNGGADGPIDVSLDASSDAGDAALSDRDAAGNPGFDIGACVPTVSTARRLTPALYLLLDNSASMGMTDMQQTMTRWAALNQAIPLFVDDVASDGLRAGVDFFPEISDAGALCAVSDYLMPAVPIAALGPMSSQGAAIAAALAARPPAGFGVIVPALTAGLQHARDWANSQAQAAPIDVVLLVDGLPTNCTTNNNTLEGAVAAAQAAALGTPPVRTHVLAVGAAPGDFSSLAVAGRTSEPVYVAESTGAAIAAGLRTVRAKSSTCEVALEGVREFGFVNFELRDADAGATRLYSTTSAAGCGTGNAWYFDNAAQPKSAVLCPVPCAALDSGASVALLVGCRTVILPP